MTTDQTPDQNRAAEAPVPFSVAGYVDGLTPRWQIVGWAREMSGQIERATVELVDGTQVVARTLAETFRADLLDAKIGDGRHGFELSIPAHLFTGVRRNFSIQVRLPGGSAVLSQLDLILPSHPPKTIVNPRAHVNGPQATNAEALVLRVLERGEKAVDTEAYTANLTRAIDSIAWEYDFATALGMLYIHILRRRIDPAGLQSRLTRLSQNPAELGTIVRDVLQSDEARNVNKQHASVPTPDLEPLRVWTRLRPPSGV